MHRLEGKVALVTGAASGLGKEISRQFITQGAKAVYIADINQSGSEQAHEELGDLARPLTMDVTSEKDWQRCLSRVVETSGKLDVLVNNAAILAFGSIEDASLEDWEHVQRVNATSVFLGCKYGLAVMKESTKSGSIINISSAASLKQNSAFVSYCASKSAVRSVTTCVALHCAEQGYPIRCNSVHPAVIDTPMMRNTVQEGQEVSEMLAQFSDTFPLKRVANVEEIAASVVYLASDETPFMTGAPLIVDGGYSL